MSSGLGVYLMRGGMTQYRAHQYRRAGIRRVILCAEAVDGWTATRPQMERWAGFARAAELEVSVYSFPGAKALAYPKLAAERFLKALWMAGPDAAPVADIEGPFAGVLGPQRFGEFMTPVWEGLSDEQRQAFVVTTLHSPSRTGALPWKEMVGWSRSLGIAIGLQVYETAIDDARVDERLAEVRAAIGLGARVFPCIATYKRGRENSEGLDGAKRLLGDLERACFAADGTPVTGCDLWSGSSFDAQELAALPAFVERMGW